MKILGQIKSIVWVRKYARQDGSIQNIHRIEFEAGSDTFLIETRKSMETMTKQDIVAGAVGYADISFSANEYKDSKFQNIYLSNFTLANRNINTEAATQPATETVTQATEQPAAPAAAPSEKTEEGKTGNLPF